MKRFLIILTVISVMTSLTGCSTYENKPVIIARAPVDLDALSPETAASPPAAEKNTAEADAVSGDDTAESDTADTPETEETAETEELPLTLSDEGLDTFYISEYAAYHVSVRDREFARKSLFVGDSICRGFEEYKIVHPENVCARGSIAARNFFEYGFYTDSGEDDYITALNKAVPEYVFLSMGMNDLNLTDEDTYCENYRTIIDETLENSSAEVYVAAITPINCEFTTNYRIDCFNVKMSEFLEENYPERVHYLDFAKHLKDSDGALKDCFNGGDGIHLSPYAYYVALWEINRSMKADGVWRA